jgi:uncharacterized protein YdhG (YjbR/CyaY superfamily)
LKTVPEKRRAALKTIRRLCKEILIDCEETIAYKLPAYKKGDDIVIGFASRKNHICFYFAIHEVMLDDPPLLKHLNHGKGVIRYSNPDKIDFEIIRKLLTDTVKSVYKPC